MDVFACNLIVECLTGCRRFLYRKKYLVVVASSPRQSPKCGVRRVEKVLAAECVGR